MRTPREPTVSGILLKKEPRDTMEEVQTWDWNRDECFLPTTHTIRIKKRGMDEEDNRTRVPSSPRQNWKITFLLMVLLKGLQREKSGRRRGGVH